MNKTSFYFFMLCLLCTFQFAHAQNEMAQSDFSRQISNPTNYWGNSKEVGLNFTPLISKLIPFNIGDKQSGLVGIKTKFYGNNIAFRFSFGSNLTEGEDNQFFHIGLGYERRRVLYEKFSYTSGWEGIVEVVQATTNSSGDPFVGFSKFYGIEYNLNDSFFIGTESSFNFGLNTFTGLTLKFNAPVAVFVNVRLPNKKK